MTPFPNGILITTPGPAPAYVISTPAVIPFSITTPGPTPSFIASTPLEAPFTIAPSSPSPVVNTPLEAPFSITIENKPVNVYASLTGPRGPVGPAGSGGLVTIVTVSGAIPGGQIYSAVNAGGNITLTLPTIASALVGGIGTPYTVVNFSAHKVNINAAGGDTGAFQINSQGTSFTLLPTPLGWLKI